MYCAGKGEFEVDGVGSDVWAKDGPGKNAQATRNNVKSTPAETWKDNNILLYIYI